MKLSPTRFALTLMLLVMVSGSARGDQFYFKSPGTVTWGGVFVNPYQANDNTEPQSNPLTIYCDDWNTEFSGNPTWNANVYALTANNLQHLRFDNITSAEGVTLSGGFLKATQYSNPN